LAGRVAEVVAVSALAALVTVAIALPVLRAPSERVFGMPIAGRHHDPFTVMEQFERPLMLGVHSQPVTDIPGALLARITGGVAAYNWLVLLSFPLSAAAAYLLARHLAIEPAGALFAAMAFAFSPFHLAHAAYHPHIAQTQWVPLYLLALWRCLDQPSPAAAALLAAATITVTLSNFYGGLIAAVITPVAALGYWIIPRRTRTRSPRQLAVTVASLAMIAAAGIAYAWYAAPAVIADRAAFAFPRGDLATYSAKWWSYLVPPVAHPLLGTTSLWIWSVMGAGAGLLEQQVSLGLAVIALGLTAILFWLVRDRQPGSTAFVPLLVVVAIASLLCSLSPERTVAGFTFVRPSALLYEAAPMFRSYARFGVVVQLMAALLAGIAVDALWRAGPLRARIACCALMAIAVCEYTVAPSAMWRDTLPISAHRWVMQQPGLVRAFDCGSGSVTSVPVVQESRSVPWLTRDRVTLAGAGTDCAEPRFAERLAATGYTHLIVRSHSEAGRSFPRHAPVDGLRVAAAFGDSEAFDVTAPVPALYVAAMTGFSPRERNPEWSWRWMGADAAWTIVNTGAGPVVVVAGLELSAFHRARRMEVRLDGRFLQTIDIEPARRMRQIDPITVTPGEHQLSFHAVDGATVAGDVIDNGDRRPLSFAIGLWSWTVQGEDR
jgi:hypothetical protein